MIDGDFSWWPSRRAVLGGGAALTLPINKGRAAPSIKRSKIRAITAFITIDREGCERQIRGAVDFLRRARSTFTGAGFETQTIRIATQPFPDYVQGLNQKSAVDFIRMLSKLAHTYDFSLSIGPAAMPGRRNDAGVEILVDALRDSANEANSTIIVADDHGVAWDLVAQAGHVIQRLGRPGPQPRANCNFAATAMLQPFCPFFPGAWHGGGGASRFSIGLQSADLVADVFARRVPFDAVGAILGEELSNQARAAEIIARSVAGNLLYAGIDPTPAPLGSVSIGAAIESLIGAPFGSPGTERACAIFTRAVKAADVTHVGFSGIMLPVLEDQRLAQRWSEGRYTSDSILAYSAVCASGLDTVPLPGRTSADEIGGLVGDVATLAFKWNKPLAARLLPAAGREVGDTARFGGDLLNEARIQPLAGAVRTF